MGAEDKPSVSLEEAKQFVRRDALFCAQLLSGLALKDIAIDERYPVWVHTQTCPLPHEPVPGVNHVPLDIVEGI